MPLKRDSDAIQAFMQGLASELGLDDNRKWWPNWLFRSDHVENAAAILNTGELLSRAIAGQRGLIVKDSASQQHIDDLSRGQRSYVRLYFRPRTPTQYHNEGIRPASGIWRGAHMPVPVYLLFSSRLLQEAGVEFCRGRLNPSAQVGASAKFLSATDFKAIYHDSAFGESNRAEITNARNSEVLVKNRLSLDHLSYVACRSGPERDTLLNFLGPAARSLWLKHIRVDEGYRRLFHKDRGTFIKDVHLSEDRSQFTFHLCEPALRGPFRLRIEWSGFVRDYKYQRSDFEAPETPLEVEFADGATEPAYDVKLWLNDDIAYFGRFRSEDPFLSPF